MLMSMLFEILILFKQPLSFHVAWGPYEQRLPWLQHRSSGENSLLHAGYLTLMQLRTTVTEVYQVAQGRVR